MVRLQDIVELLNPRKNRLLLYAEAALPERQFAAFRKLLLDELGNGGLIRDLEGLYGTGQDRDTKDRHGAGRHIHAGKEADHV